MWDEQHLSNRNRMMVYPGARAPPARMEVMSIDFVTRTAIPQKLLKEIQKDKHTQAATVGWISKRRISSSALD